MCVVVLECVWMCASDRLGESDREKESRCVFVWCSECNAEEQLMKSYILILFFTFTVFMGVFTFYNPKGKSPGKDFSMNFLFFYISHWFTRLIRWKRGFSTALLPQPTGPAAQMLHSQTNYYIFPMGFSLLCHNICISILIWIIIHYETTFLLILPLITDYTFHLYLDS